jgi:hypothetical protein
MPVLCMPPLRKVLRPTSIHPHLASGRRRTCRPPLPRPVALEQAHHDARVDACRNLEHRPRHACNVSLSPLCPPRSFYGPTLNSPIFLGHSPAHPSPHRPGPGLPSSFSCARSSPPPCFWSRRAPSPTAGCPLPSPAHLHIPCSPILSPAPFQLGVLPSVRPVVLQERCVNRAKRRHCTAGPSSPHERHELSPPPGPPPSFPPALPRSTPPRLDLLHLPAPHALPAPAPPSSSPCAWSSSPRVHGPGARCL